MGPIVFLTFALVATFVDESRKLKKSHYRNLSSRHSTHDQTFEAPKGDDTMH